MSGHRLDVCELYRRLDAQRRARALLWQDVADQCGLSPSTLARVKAGSAPDAHGLVSLLVWLNCDAAIAHLVQPRETP